jgi:hypothetical protein
MKLNFLSGPPKRASAFFAILMAFLFVLGCKKDLTTPPDAFNTPSMLSIEDAKRYFDAQVQKEAAIVQRDTTEKPMFKFDWAQAISYYDLSKHQAVVEVPVIESRAKRILANPENAVVDTAQFLSMPKNNRLIIVQDTLGKKGYAIMKIDGTYQYMQQYDGTPDNNYRYLDEDFDGFISYVDMNDGLLQMNYCIDGFFHNLSRDTSPQVVGAADERIPLICIKYTVEAWVITENPGDPDCNPCIEYSITVETDCYEVTPLGGATYGGISYGNPGGGIATEDGLPVPSVSIVGVLPFFPPVFTPEGHQNGGNGSTNGQYDPTTNHPWLNPPNNSGNTGTNGVIAEKMRQFTEMYGDHVLDTDCEMNGVNECDFEGACMLRAIAICKHQELTGKYPDYASNNIDIVSLLDQHGAERYLAVTTFYEAFQAQVWPDLPDFDTFEFYMEMFGVELLKIGVSFIPVVGPLYDIYDSCGELSWTCVWSVVTLFVPVSQFGSVVKNYSKIKAAWTTAKTFENLVSVYKFLKGKMPAIKKNIDALKYVKKLADGPSLGGYFATVNNFGSKFKAKFPEVSSQIGDVHHAVPQWVTSRYGHLSLTQNQIHSLENLRGIPANGSLDHTTITNYWEAFHHSNPSPGLDEVLDYAKWIDDNFGHLFIPPVR